MRKRSFLSVSWTPKTVSLNPKTPSLTPKTLLVTTKTLSLTPKTLRGGPKTLSGGPKTMVYRSEADDARRSGRKVCTFLYGLSPVLSKQFTDLPT